MDDGTPALEVGFAIGTGDSATELMRLQDVMNSTEAKVVAEAARIEKATAGMVNLGGSVAQITAFGNAATRELREVARATDRAERSGEAMVRQLNRQIETFGKTSSEIREMRAEMRAVEAESQGLTELAGRIRAASAQMNLLEAGTRGIGQSGKLASHHMQNLAFQFQDLGIQMAAAAGSSAPLKMAFMALMQQGAQIQGIMSQAGIGIRGVGAAFADMSKSLIVAVATNPVILGLSAAIGAVALAIKTLQSSANDGSGMEEYAKSLGLTEKEIRKLDDVTVTFGDTAKAVFQVTGRAIWSAIGPSVTSVWNVMKEWIGWIGGGVRGAVNFMIGGFIGAYNTITKSWRGFPAVLGDVFISGVNAAIGAINTLVQKAIDGINFLSRQANKILPSALQIPELDAPQIAKVNNQFKGAFAEFGATAREEMARAIGTDYVGEAGSAIVEQARQNARDRIREQAEAAGYLDPDKSSGTKQRLSEEEKAYQAALKAANDYIAAQQEEATRIGKSAKEIRLMTDAVQRMNAPLESQKLAIDQVAAAREAAYSAQAAKDFEANVMKPLRDELALYGLVGPERAAAALELEKQAFLTAHMDDGLEVAQARWEEYYAAKKQLIDKDAAAAREADAIRRAQENMEALIDAANRAGDALSRAFGSGGEAIANMLTALTNYSERQAKIQEQVRQGTLTQGQAAQRTGILTAGAYGDMAEAARDFFDEGSSGYKAMTHALQVFRAIEFALSVKAIAQDAIETASSIAKSGARTAVKAVEAVVSAISSLPFPLNLAAGAATIAALASIGVSIAGAFGGGSSSLPQSNTGTGTVLGDADAKSESIKNAIDQLKDVDTTMLTYSRQMAASLSSIESQIGSLASLVVRTGDVNADTGVDTGFKANLIGSVLGSIPLIGGILGGLFGTKTTITGSGLYAAPQSLGDILSGGFDASYYSDVQKKKKLFGITTSTKYSTQYADADTGLESQFTLLLKQFDDAILAAAGPLGVATSTIENRLNSFVVDIGKIDLKDLTGDEIEEKLNAVFGAAADDMAEAAFPFISQFQEVGEGAFETLVRVASTVETVTSTLDLLSQSAQDLGIAAKMGLADQFDSLSDFSSAAQAYLETYYTSEEQAAALTAQMADVFDGLGLAMPDTLASFRQLVEAQDLTTDAGQATYATLLKLAPAFAEVQEAMNGAKSAADILSERQDLERQLLELRGDTAALREMELAKLDASNRALQEEIWALEDAQDAASAAQELADAWTSAGDSIADEIERIRGLTSTDSQSYVTLLSQFNAATAAARGGDIDAANSLPQLSQSLLNAAALVATSRQELARVQAQTAASLEQTNAVIAGLAGASSDATDAALLAASATTQDSTSSDSSQVDLAAALDDMRAELEQLRSDMNAGMATVAGNTGKISRTLDNVTSASGGDAITTVQAA